VFSAIRNQYSVQLYVLITVNISFIYFLSVSIAVWDKVMETTSIFWLVYDQTKNVYVDVIIT
jgi:hypothetical protein